MIRGAFLYTAVSALLAVGIALLAGRWVSAAHQSSVWTGAGSAFVCQVAVFWLLFVWAFPHRPVLAYGLGMLGRFALVGLTALVWVPVAGLSPAPTLLSMVAVLFATTLLEPVFLKPVFSGASRSGAAPTLTRR